MRVDAAGMSYCIYSSYYDCGLNYAAAEAAVEVEDDAVTPEAAAVDGFFTGDRTMKHDGYIYADLSVMVVVRMKSA